MKKIMNLFVLVSGFLLIADLQGASVLKPTKLARDAFFQANSDVVYCAHDIPPIPTKLFRENRELMDNVIKFSSPEKKTVILSSKGQDILEELLGRKLGSRALGLRDVSVAEDGAPDEQRALVAASIVFTHAVIAAALRKGETQAHITDLLKRLEEAKADDAENGKDAISTLVVPREALSVEASTQAAQVAAIVADMAQAGEIDEVEPGGCCQRLSSYITGKYENATKKQKIAIGIAGVIITIAVLKYFKNPVYIALEDMLFAIVKAVKVKIWPVLKQYRLLFDLIMCNYRGRFNSMLALKCIDDICLKNFWANLHSNVS